MHRGKVSASTGNFFPSADCLLLSAHDVFIILADELSSWVVASWVTAGYSLYGGSCRCLSWNQRYVCWGPCPCLNQIIQSCLMEMRVTRLVSISNPTGLNCLSLACVCDAQAAKIVFFCVSFLSFFFAWLWLFRDIIFFFHAISIAMH